MHVAFVFGALRPKFAAPIPDGLIGNVDASFQQYLFHFGKALVETNVQPDRMRDDFRRNVATFVANELFLHRPELVQTLQ